MVSQPKKSVPNDPSRGGTSYRASNGPIRPFKGQVMNTIDNIHDLDESKWGKVALDGGEPRWSVIQFHAEGGNPAPIIKFTRFHLLVRARMFAFGTRGPAAIEKLGEERVNPITEGYQNGQPCWGFKHKEFDESPTK